MKQMKKKFPNLIITNKEDKIFKNKTINLVSIASYDQDHYKQIMKCIKYGKTYNSVETILLNN